MLRRQHHGPVRVAQQELIEPRQRQHRALPRHAVVEQRRRCGRQPVAGPRELELHQAVLDLGQGCAGFRQGNAGPPGKITFRGGAVAAQVAQQPLGDAVRAVQGPRLRDPVVERHHQLLVACQRTLHQQTPLAQDPQQMDAALARRGLARPFEGLEQLSPAGCSCGDQPQGGSRCGVHVRVIDAEVPVATGHASDQPFGGNGQHPFQVLGCQHVQGAAHGPRTDDLRPVQRPADVIDAGTRHPLADGPERGLQVLGLHCRHPADGFRDGLKTWAQQSLGGQPQPAHDPGAKPADARHCCHGSMVSRLCWLPGCCPALPSRHPADLFTLDA